MSLNASFNSSDSNNTEATIALTPKKEDINLLLSISKTLSQIINENKQLKSYFKKVKEQSKMVFSADRPPEISLYDYLFRIKYYAEVANSSLILALIYIDRLCLKGNLILTPHNIHRILFASIICGVKYNEDDIYENKFYAEVGGVSLRELNKMEFDIVDLIGFNFFVDKKEFNQYENYLQIICKKN